MQEQFVWSLERCQPCFHSGIESIPFCNLNSQACLVVYSETLKSSATLEIDMSQGRMVKSWNIFPLSSAIASFSLMSSTNQQQFKQSVLCPSKGSSTAIATSLLTAFVTLFIFLFPVWRVLLGLTVSCFSSISTSFSMVMVEAATLSLAFLKNS